MKKVSNNSKKVSRPTKAPAPKKVAAKKSQTSSEEVVAASPYADVTNHADAAESPSPLSSQSPAPPLSVPQSPAPQPLAPKSSRDSSEGSEKTCSDLSSSNADSTVADGEQAKTKAKLSSRARAASRPVAEGEGGENVSKPTSPISSPVSNGNGRKANRGSDGDSASPVMHGRPNATPSFLSAYQPITHSSDRIAIFIDGSNLFYAASHLNIEVDYRRLLATLVRGRRLLRAYFYTGVDPQNEKQRGFLLWLNRHGHRVVSKELTHLPDGSRKANMHVEMAVDMMRIAEHCSTLTLLGGDGNLAYALQVLSARGTFIEVVSLQSMTSDSLIDLADTYVDLADLRDDIKR